MRSRAKIFQRRWTIRSQGATRQTRRPRSSASRRGFTLIEVLAALLLMAIVVPVAMHAMSVATRAGIMGQRKAAAMRVAERVLTELIVTGQAVQAGNSGTIAEGNATYAWTLETESWTEDAMLQLTVKVDFSVQGNSYSVHASTLLDPTAAGAGTEIAATEVNE